jgi:acetyl esterase/lipase
MFRVASNRSALLADLAVSVDTPAIFQAAAKAWRQLNKALFDTYRPELHYMRGPGPKWREKHGALQTTRSSAVLLDAVVIVAENDVLRDEGECYARKLSLAGVRVTSTRYNGTIHDFLLLNALSDTPAARSALVRVTTAPQVVLQ